MAKKKVEKKVEKPIEKIETAVVEPRAATLAECVSLMRKHDRERREAAAKSDRE